MPVRILEDDSVNDCTHKIFNHFEVGQSCAITGYELNYVPKEGQEVDWTKVDEKGKLVWNQLYLKDRALNTDKNGKRKPRYAGPNTIGGQLAGKIFKYSRVIINGKPKWTIWRLQ